MAKRFTPWGISWNELSQELRGLQNRISLNQGRFKEVGRHDIAEDLERCIHLLIRAQMVADELCNRGADTRQKKKTADKQAGGHDYERSRLSNSIAKR